jgi:hypothetical protein
VIAYARTCAYPLVERHEGGSDAALAGTRHPYELDDDASG